MAEKKPRKLKDVIVKVESASISRLREAIIDYREREQIWKINTNRLKWEIQKLKDSKKKLREEKNVRYDKLRWQLLKRDQRVWVLLNIIKKRRRQKRAYQRQGMKWGRASANRKARGKYLNMGVEMGKARGYKVGFRDGKGQKVTEMYHRGVQVGKNKQRTKYFTGYNHRRKLVYKVESVARLAVITHRLVKALKMSNNIVSFMLWCSQHEFWTKQDIDAAFSDIKFDEYYTCINRLKRHNLIEPMMKVRGFITWRFTVKGRELVTKMNAYISKYFNNKLNK